MAKKSDKPVDEVVIKLGEDDLTFLNWLLGLAAGNLPREELYRAIALTNKINRENPNWMPFPGHDLKS